jgi:hypothetical protein
MDAELWVGMVFSSLAGAKANVAQILDDES